MGKGRSSKGFLGFGALKNWAFKSLAKVLPVLMPYVLTLGFTIGITSASYAFAVQGDFFTLRQMSFEPYGAVDAGFAYRLTGLKPGDKILFLDLKRIEETILARNPEYKEVAIRRALPDELRISLKKRAPVAQIESKGFYLVDAEGVVLTERLAAPVQGLTVLRGAKEEKGIKKGSRLERTSFGRAIQLLRDVYRLGVLRGNRLTGVDAGDAKNVILWVNDRIEVRITSRNLASQLKKVADATLNLDMDPEKIRYIDLRFDDIVIGPR